MSYQIESEIKRIAQEQFRQLPEYYMMRQEIAELKERIAQMEKCCICIKMNSEPDPAKQFVG